MARQNLFWLQLRALIWKNWIVLSHHSFVRPFKLVLVSAAHVILTSPFQLTLLRCFILPIAYGAFLATAQIFLNRLNNVCSTPPPESCS